MTIIMKKYISLFATALLLTIGFASCSVETDEPAGGTAVEKMAGHWIVTVDAIVDGEVYEDPYGMGSWDMYTYNTADNDADKMWFTDGNNFWGYEFKIPINLSERTFEIKDQYIYDDDEGEPVYCTVTDGKIIENGGTNVNGKPTDAIDYKIEFTDDAGTIYHVHGVRYAGF